MRLPHLKALWHAESEAYKKSEVGTGVQRFVWEMLKSEDLFNLTGNCSPDLGSRMTNS